MTYTAKERLECYASRWTEAAIGFDRLGIWTVILVMVGFQAVLTAFVFQSHGVDPEAAETMSWVFQATIVTVFAWVVRWDSIVAAAMTEAAYHLGYVDFEESEGDHPLETVRSPE